MNDINEIQFEERNVTSAILWGILSGLYFGIVAYIHDDGLIKNNLFSGLLYLSVPVIYVLIIIWVVKIAKKLKRPPFIWGFFAFLSSPLTLIVIGFQDVKIEDKIIKKIVDELRLEFNTELLHIKSTKDLSAEELHEVEIKLKEKFNQKLKDRISDSRFKEKMASGNLAEDDGNIIEEEKEEEEVVQSVSNQKWTSETGKCPACGAPLSDSAVICPDCGLSIN